MNLTLPSGIGAIIALLVLVIVVVLVVVGQVVGQMAIWPLGALLGALALARLL